MYLWLITDDQKLKVGKLIEILAEGNQQILRLHQCQLSDSSSIKFISKTAESAAKLIVIGMYCYPLYLLVFWKSPLHNCIKVLQNLHMILLFRTTCSIP